MLANADGGYFAIGFYHIEAGLDCNYSIFMPDSVNLAVYTIYSHVARSFDNDNAFGRLIDMPSVCVSSMPDGAVSYVFERPDSPSA